MIFLIIQIFLISFFCESSIRFNPVHLVNQENHGSDNSLIFFLFRNLFDYKSFTRNFVLNFNIMKNIFIYIFASIILLPACRESQPEKPVKDPRVAVLEDTTKIREAQTVSTEKPKVVKGKMLPVDQAALNPDFESFRKRVLRIIEYKDVNGLKDILDKNIKFSFGDPTGKENFIQHWKLNNKGTQSEVWKELRDVMDLGGYFEEANQKRFVAPYTFAELPNEYDPFEYGIITAENVRMRSRPGLNGKVLETLSYDLVKMIQTRQRDIQTIAGETYPWHQVETLDGKKGYVFGQYLRTQIDYRAFFEENDGDWKMTIFIAGD